MGRESVIVNSSSHGIITIEPYKDNACQACSLKSSCGQYLLVAAGMVRKVKVPVKYFLGQSANSIEAGSRGQVVIADASLVSLSLLLYLSPLIAMLTPVLLSRIFGLSEAMTILLSFSALGLSLVILHRYIQGQDLSKTISIQLDSN